MISSELKQGWMHPQSRTLQPNEVYECRKLNHKGLLDTLNFYCPAWPLTNFFCCQ
jgi:hypothetical protein